MMKELIARLALVLFIIGLTSEVAQDGEVSDTAKQRPSNTADVPGEP
jgi:hypothetical protein